MANSRIDVYLCFISVAFVVLGSAEKCSWPVRPADGTGVGWYSSKYCTPSEELAESDKDLNEATNLCRLDPSCHAFYIGGQTGKYFKCEYGENYREKHSSICSTLYTISCFEKNWAYPGNDIGEKRTSKTPEECQKLCAETAGCAAFTFRANKNGCWLKDTPTAGEKSKGAISGNQYSSNHCGDYLGFPA